MSSGGNGKGPQTRLFCELEARLWCVLTLESLQFGHGIQGFYHKTSSSVHVALSLLRPARNFIEGRVPILQEDISEGTVYLQ
jgi:hypothetical protein